MGRGRTSRCKACCPNSLIERKHIHRYHDENFRLNAISIAITEKKNVFTTGIPILPRLHWHYLISTPNDVAFRIGPLNKHAKTSKLSVAIFSREFPIPLRYKVSNICFRFIATPVKLLLNNCALAKSSVTSTLLYKMDLKVIIFLDAWSTLLILDQIFCMLYLNLMKVFFYYCRFELRITVVILFFSNCFPSRRMNLFDIV